MSQPKRKKILPKTFTSTVYLADSRYFEIDERLSVCVIEREARTLNAVRVVLDNGTEIYLNKKYA